MFIKRSQSKQENVQKHGHNVCLLRSETTISLTITRQPFETALFPSLSEPKIKHSTCFPLMVLFAAGKSAHSCHNTIGTGSKNGSKTICPKLNDEHSYQGASNRVVRPKTKLEPLRHCAEKLLRIYLKPLARFPFIDCCCFCWCCWCLQETLHLAQVHECTGVNRARQNKELRQGYRQLLHFQRSSRSARPFDEVCKCFRWPIKIK